ncbi:MAG: hypothetical protein WD468_00360 [Pirellulales bacterium]
MPRYIGCFVLLPESAALRAGGLRSWIFVVSEREGQHFEELICTGASPEKVKLFGDHLE